MNGHSRYEDVLVLSDWHVGHVVGLWPENFETSTGIVHNINVGQRYLLEQLDKLALWVAARPKRPIAVVFNGDMVDGKQPLQRAMEAVTSNPADQAEALEKLIRRFLQVSTIEDQASLYFVQGTEYHDEKSGTEVERVAKSVGAVRYGGRGTGIYSKEVLDLEVVDGRVINFQHGISVAGGLYRATPPDREGIWAALAAREGKLPNADVVVRSHAHYFVHVEHEKKHIFITPCFQLQTRYMRKHSAYRMLPSIGGVIVKVYEDVGEGEDPVRVEKKLFPLPPYKPTKVEKVRR